MVTYRTAPLMVTIAENAGLRLIIDHAQQGRISVSLSDAIEARCLVGRMTGEGIVRVMREASQLSGVCRKKRHGKGWC